MLQRLVHQRACFLVGLMLVLAVGSPRPVRAGIEYDEIVTIEKDIFCVNCPIIVTVYLDCLDCWSYPSDRYCMPLESFRVDARVGGACFVRQWGSCGEPFLCEVEEDLDPCPWWEPNWGLPEGPCWNCPCQRCTGMNGNQYIYRQGPYCRAFIMEYGGSQSFTIESDTPGYGTFVVNGSRPCQLHPPYDSKHYYDHFSDCKDFIVVEPNLGVDSNNDGVYNGSDEAIEDRSDLPGLYVGMNDDFDEEDDFEDWELPIRASKKPCPNGQYAVVPTDDLKRIHVSLPPGGDDLYCELRAYLTGGRDKLRVYAIRGACDATCPSTGEGDCWVLIGESYDLAANYLHSQGPIHGWDLYVEGTLPGKAQMSLEVWDGGDKLCEDKVQFTVVKIDADMDSDNTNTTAPYGPDAADPMTEDRIEQRAGEPGRFVLVNDDDDDQDGILDFDDGYNMNGDTDPDMDDDDRTYKDADHKEDDFVMLKVKIEPSSVDLSVAWVDVRYVFSSPDPDVQGSGLGRLRLWKRAGDEARDRRSAWPDDGPGEGGGPGEGDWICPALYKDLRQLMPGNIAPSHEMTFYIEGVQASQLLGDNPIWFELDPDGPGPAGYVHMDIVQVTVVDINIETNSDNNGTIDAADNMIEDEFPGRAMWPNADDDNNSPDNKADLEENGQVVGENDLAEIHVDVVPEIPNLTVKLEASPANLVKVWLQADKTTAAPMQWSAQNLPYTLWVEGLAQAGTATLTLSLLASPGAKDSVKMTVFKVKTVEWAKYMDNRDLEGCVNNGGKAIFPDGIWYVDQDIGRRKWVTITATVEPQAKDVIVYFREFDVDDPFDQRNPGWPGVADVDNDFSGPDNRGTHDFPTPYQSAVTLTTAGEVQTWLGVSPRPGDNYAVGATTTPQLFLNRFPPGNGPPNSPNPLAIEALMSAGGDADNAAKVTEMLTVWRRLHLELDSMTYDADLNGEVSDRNIDAVWPDTPHQGMGESGAEINNWNPGDDGRYEGGTLTVNRGGMYQTYEIVDHWDDADDDTLYVLGDITVDLNRSASFADDDVRQLPRLADISLIREKYRPAYIVDQLEPLVWDMLAPFVANLPDDTEGTLAAVCEPTLDQWTSPSYWTVQILACHQGVVAQDGDPDYVYHRHGPGNQKQGDAAWLLGESPQGGLDSDDNIVGIFLETIKDKEVQEAYWATLGVPDPIYPKKEARTVVHEVAHLFGLVHAPGGSHGIMDPNDNDPTNVFSGGELATIRSTTHIEKP